MRLPIFVTSPPGQASAVTSVAGRVGAVVLTVADIAGAEATANKGVANGYASLGAGGLVPAAQLGTGTADATHTLFGDGTFKAAVTSVAGRTGAVVLAVADVTNAESTANKGVASGYASLDSSTLVPTAQHGTGTADNTKFLRGDRTWTALPTAGAAVATVATAEALTSTTYTDAATVGPAVTWTPGPSGKALVVISADLDSSGAPAESLKMSFALSSGNVQAASDNLCISVNRAGQIRASGVFLLSGLAASSTVATAKYRTAGGASQTVSKRDLIVIPL